MRIFFKETITDIYLSPHFGKTGLGGKKKTKICFFSLLNSIQRVIVNTCIGIFQCLCWIKSEFKLYMFEVFLFFDNIRQLVCMWGFSMEAIISSREPMISSRPGIGIEKFCWAKACAPVHKRVKIGNWARNSHSLSLIFLSKDHHAMRGSLWMLKCCSSQ